MLSVNIEEIMTDFGSEPRIFQSEAQFQFEMAWELQKQCQRKNAKVLLEMVTATELQEKRKRYYSDIVIRNCEGEYIVIELKYKTKKSTYGDIELLHHGANDLGRFDYLWDLHRIQLLKNHDNGRYRFNSSLQRFVAGYAIMLTNDERYWTVSRRSLQNQRPLYYDFCIGNGDEIPSGTVLKWKDGENCVRGTCRDCSLTFEKSYRMEWRDYYFSNDLDSKFDLDFKYLILNV